MAGDADGDGRLDRDDLDDVLDGALVVENGGDVLEAGSQWRWSDRIADSRPVRGLRENRRRTVAGLAVVALVAAAGVAVARRVPPPFDPAFRVVATTTPVRDETQDARFRFVGDGIALFESGVRRVAVQLTRVDGGSGDDADRYAAVALTGPGIRSSRVTPRLQPSGRDYVADVDVVVDCSDDAAFDARADDYRLVVTKVDRFDRIATRHLVYPGPSDWTEHITNGCLHDRLASALVVEGVAIRPDAAARALDLTLSLRSDLLRSMRLQGPEYGVGPLTVSVPPVRVAAGRRASLAARLAVHDCGQITEPEVSTSTPTGEEARGFGVEVGVEVPRGDAVAPLTTYTVLFWPSSIEQRVRAALASSCAGAPTVTVGVGSAKRVDAVVGGSSRRLMPLHIEMGTTGRRASIARLDDGASVLESTTAPVRDGRAVLPTTYGFDCVDARPPPYLQIVVDTDHGSYPFLRTLDDATLRQAVLDSCAGNLTETTMTDMGWSSPTSSSA